MRPQPLRSPPRSRPARGQADRPPSGPASHTGGLNSGLMLGVFRLAPLPLGGYRIHTSVSVGSVLHASACPDPGAQSTGYVMGCHVLSCAGSAWRGRTGPAAVVPVRRSGYSARFLRLAVSGIGLSSRSVFASFSRRPAARRGGPTMPRAIARGRAGALAPARFARLIAPAREPERRAHLSCPPHRWFSAPAPVREGAASGNRSRSIVLFLF